MSDAIYPFEEVDEYKVLFSSVLHTISDPNTRLLVVCRHPEQVRNLGGAFDTATKFFSNIDTEIKVNRRALIITLASGAVIRFVSMNNAEDKHKIMGKQFSCVAISKIHLFDKETVSFILSRIRSVYVEYPLTLHVTEQHTFDSFRLLSFSSKDIKSVLDYTAN